MDKLIQSIAGKGGLTSNVDLIIKNADFSANEKERIINNVLAEFNEKRLVLNNFEFDVTDAIAKAKLLITSSMGSIVIGGSGGLNETPIVRAPAISNTAPDVIIPPAVIDKAISEISSNVIDNNKVTLTKILTPEEIATVAANLVETPIYLGDSSLSDKITLTKAPEKTFNQDEYISAETRFALMTNEAWMTKIAASNPYIYDQIKWSESIDPGTPINLSGFAKGGISNQPAIFGEAGAEAAVPLPDGRSIPVTLYNASNDSSVNSAETIAELKSQNQKLEILVNTMMATSKAEREKTQELIDAMNGLRTDTRLKNKA